MEIQITQNSSNFRNKTIGIDNINWWLNHGEYLQCSSKCTAHAKNIQMIHSDFTDYIVTW